jgi:hypothetical protein
MQIQIVDSESIGDVIAAPLTKPVIDATRLAIKSESRIIRHIGTTTEYCIGGTWGMPLIRCSIGPKAADFWT